MTNDRQAAEEALEEIKELHSYGTWYPGDVESCYLKHAEIIEKALRSLMDVTDKNVGDMSQPLENKQITNYSVASVEENDDAAADGMLCYGAKTYLDQKYNISRYSQLNTDTSKQCDKVNTSCLSPAHIAALGKMVGE